MTNQKVPATATPVRSSDTPAKAAAERLLSPEAERALAEAAERRAKALKEAEDSPQPAKEIDGPAGPEPVRYGDWENNGRASDF